MNEVKDGTASPAPQPNCLLMITSSAMPGESDADRCSDNVMLSLSVSSLQENPSLITETRQQRLRSCDLDEGRFQVKSSDMCRFMLAASHSILFLSQIAGL